MDTVAAPPTVDWDTWMQARDALLKREKAHTREGDAIAAARRRLPMFEVRNISLQGENGPTPLLDMFEGRDLLITCHHMWHDGKPFEDQCEGCTLTIWATQDTTYLEARGVSYAVWCQGPYEEFAPFREFMGYRMPWYSLHGVAERGVSDGWLNAYLRIGDRIFLTYATDGRGAEAIMPALQLLDMTVYGRREQWEDSPDGWPQPDAVGADWWRQNGRPVGQWTRLGA
ncbi:DUF899 family protein [Humibacter antri]